MILADKLKELTTYSPAALTRILNASGYKKDIVTEAKFLGMTNGGQFCYSVTYTDMIEGDECTTKVFVSYDPTEGRVLVDY